MNSKIEALRARKADGGFTLVELLIVIVVLGILAGITVFGISSMSDRAEVAACQASARTVETAAAAYRAELGGYPTAAQLTASYVVDGTTFPALVDQIPAGVTYTQATGQAVCA